MIARVRRPLGPQGWCAKYETTPMVGRATSGLYRGAALPCPVRTVPGATLLRENEGNILAVVLRLSAAILVGVPTGRDTADHIDARHPGVTPLGRRRCRP
jgi:hypothetical protein